MTVGDPLNTECNEQELLFVDDVGRILELYSKGVYGDGMNDPTNGVFNMGYPTEEHSNYKSGTITADISGTADTDGGNQLIDSTANFPDWVEGCMVYNATDDKYALVGQKVNVTTLRLRDQGDGADIFPDGDEDYVIFASWGVTIGGTVYSYIVDVAAAWTPEYGKGTAHNYLSVRGLWCGVEKSTGYMERRRILSNESNKLWFEGAWSTSPRGGDTYYVAPIYYEFETGYIYPKFGNSLSLAALRQTVVSTNGTTGWFELFGSGTDQGKEATAGVVKSVSKSLRNEPQVNIVSERHRYVQPRFSGFVMDDQLVWRRIDLLFDNHER